MHTRSFVAAILLGSIAWFGLPAIARADGNLRNVNHIIIVMQENRSFDHYFGVLPYVPGGPYHGGHGSCAKHDHRCVDGLRCRVESHGDFVCANSNVDDDGSVVHSFHEQTFCIGPDLDHSWPGSHKELNFEHPADTLFASLNDGFVLQNDIEGQPDSGPETPTDDDTMGFYTQDDLPFYYSLAQTFAINDRYFSSLIGPTFPNRSYLLAATSFGHLTTSEIFPPPGGYKPITGTIMDLLDEHGVSWVDYFSEIPQTFSFLPSVPPFVTPHAQPLSAFMAAAAAGTLPAVSFVDPIFGILLGVDAENDEHPPTNVRKGEAFVSSVVNAVRNSPSWKDSIIFVVYDEHGGFYDHVAPPRAPQHHARNPDGIDPGQCADLSNPPASTEPGGGANCDTISPADALAICPAFTRTGPYPSDCPNFDQLGIRLPFIAVSPFAKRHYVSHTVGDHTSLLALIEKRFLSDEKTRRSQIPHLTERDGNADTLEDMFDFSHPPSMDAAIPTAPGASPSDPGCPFVPPS